jgi:TrmH family RNA methyltransferase
MVAVELRDPGNLGTLIRTAEAAGCGGIVVTGTTVDPLNPKVVRASAGSVLRLPVVEIAEVGPCLAAVRAAGRLLVATVVDPKADHYDQVDLRVAAILVGNEPRGLDASVVDQVDLTVTIPMEAGIESLNVAAAGAVMAFESARQRRAGSDRS